MTLRECNNMQLSSVIYRENGKTCEGWIRGIWKWLTNKPQVVIETQQGFFVLVEPENVLGLAHF